MKPLVIPKNYKLQAKLDTAPNTAFDYIISYTESWAWYFNEAVIWWTLNSIDYTTILDNTSNYNFVIWEASFYNKDTNENTLYIAIYDWTNTYEIWKVWIKNWNTIDLTNFIESQLVVVDEKVKADKDDPASWFLSNKVDNSTIEVDITNHYLQLKDWWIVEAKLSNNIDASSKWFNADKVDGKDASDFELVANKLIAFQATPDDTHYISEKLAKDSLDWKEDAFTKNTAFNKNFWTASWDVMEWDTNVGIVGTKIVDETNIADWTIIQYNKTDDKYVCVAPPTWWWGWWIDTVVIAWDQVQWTMFYEFDADSDKTVWNVSVSLQTPPSWQDFIVTWYNNWTSVWTTTILTTATAINSRYKTVTALNTALVAWDVFTGKITQVWNTVSWSELSALINIS